MPVIGRNRDSPIHQTSTAFCMGFYESDFDAKHP
jgi:hypothetical protein